MSYRTIKIRLGTYRRLKRLAAEHGKSLLDLVDHLAAQEEQQTQKDPVEPEEVGGQDSSLKATTDTGAN